MHQFSQVFQSRKAKILLSGFFLAAFAVTAGFAFQGHARAAAYQRLLENGYQHAFAELTTAVSELDTALQKGAYATSPALISSLCTQAYGKAMSGQMAIGELPYGNVELEQTASFLAKAGDFAMYLSKTALSDGGCTAEHRETLSALSLAAGDLNGTLQSLQSDLNAGALTLEDLQAAERRLSGATEGGEDTPAGSAFQTVEGDFPELPSLLYDGPFSDHIASRAPRMLENTASVARDEGRALAASFLNLRPEIFTPVSEGAGKLPTWGFSATVDGGELYVEVTKSGGNILTLMNARAVDGAILTRDEAVGLAAKFLEERGFPHMAETYAIDQGNVLTVNFAARQDGVICYPDLIKVSVALDTGSVVGFESEGYLMNHAARSLPAPSVSVEQAQPRAGTGLIVLSHQLALIPTGGENEVLCHEFKCGTGGGRHYIVYVNAQTGQEEKILILLEDESGVLAI